MTVWSNSSRPSGDRAVGCTVETALPPEPSCPLSMFGDGSTGYITSFVQSPVMTTDERGADHMIGSIPVPSRPSHLSCPVAARNPPSSWDHSNVTSGVLRGDSRFEVQERLFSP